ncbi:MAG: SGNH/GDSL hydrolase family protein [Isosphaeraceae bacterium]
MWTLYTFGDSILDSGAYNPLRLTAGELLVRNDDDVFPEFRGRDLSALGPTRLEHRAVDGSTVENLRGQLRGLTPPHSGESAAIVTVGGNDLLAGLLLDPGPGFREFARSLEEFLRVLPVRPVWLGNVYDPTCGDDSRNFLGITPALARAGLARMNATLAEVAGRLGPSEGGLVDLHAHFLTGDASWFQNVIEPSLTGASEVRRAFLPFLTRSHRQVGSGS